MEQIATIKIMITWRILKNFFKLIFASTIGFAVLSSNITAPIFIFLLIWHIMTPKFYYNIYFYISAIGAIASYAIPYYGRYYLYNKTIFGPISKEKHIRSAKDLFIDIGLTIFTMGIVYIIFSSILK